MNPDSAFTWETCKAVINDILCQQSLAPMRTVEQDVLQGIWNGMTYRQIAEMLNYSENTINRDIANKLWKKLSEALAQPIKRSNFKVVVEAHWLKLSRDRPTIPPPQTSSTNNNRFPFYVERPPVEQQCLEAIAQPGALIRIRAPRKMGKSSLLSRLLSDAATLLEYSTVPFNLMRLNESLLNDTDLFLKKFCTHVSKHLGLSNQVEDYWSQGFDSNTTCNDYMEEYVLPSGQKNLVLAIDNADRLFPFEEVAENFFSLLRAWYEDARTLEIWQRLRIVIVHSTDIYPMLDQNRSPFNVGLPITLNEFNPKQGAELAQRFGLISDSEPEEFSTLYEMVGGHPDLMASFFDYIRLHPEADQTALLSLAPTDEGLFSHHLRDLLAQVKSNPELIAALQQLIDSPRPIRIIGKSSFQLQSLGLVKPKGNDVVLRCPLYRDYFRDRLALGG